MGRDRHHDDAMAELFRNARKFAAALLSAIKEDGDQAELAIIRCQLANAPKLAPEKSG